MLEFWAKTADTDSGPVVAKPVLHHLLDVAAVAWVLLNNDPAWTKRIANCSRVDAEQVPRLLSLFAGLHDLGKVSAPFQAKCPELWPGTVLGPFPVTGLHDHGHWKYTAVLMKEPAVAAILDRISPDIAGCHRLIAAIAGHHGQPPPAEEFGVPFLSRKESLPPASCDVASQIVSTLIDTLGVPQILKLEQSALEKFDFLLNGIITLCDWIGSDAQYFPIEPVIERDPSAYWQRALQSAEKALTAKGVLAKRLLGSPAFQDIGLPPASDLRPMQRAAVDLAFGDGPQLFIIEDTTGSGKTEAALMLAARLMAAGKGEGIYFALPTMATANAMHGRLEPVHRRLFDADEPTLVLAHAKARLAGKLKALRGQGAGDGDVAASVNAWVSDNRKLALFADVGAGTVDQAFLGVLRKRHIGLRHAALSRRILIVDEAHSFDRYMVKELETLLQAQAVNGGSAIVLSATLSMDQRQALAEAFAGGLPGRVANRFGTTTTTPVVATISNTAYPLATRIDGSGANEVPVGFDERLRRRVGIKRLADRQSATGTAVEAAHNGAAVCVICNAVDEAVDVYRALCEKLKEPGDAMLFHARFALGDRLAIEERVLATFGKDANDTERQGKILVATQVVEQSLDLDFDVMISDLAPVDMLIQRAGRLWRHMEKRPATVRPVSEPVLHVVCPEPASVADKEWLEQVLGKAAFVYRHPGVMWRSARVLFDAGEICVPDHLRSMIEGVYGASAIPLPPCLEAAVGNAEGEEGAHASLADYNTINLAEGYAALGGKLSNDETIGTRLGEETITIRLARRDQGVLLPWFDSESGDAMLDWQLSEVTVNLRLWRKVSDAALSGTEVDALRATWPEYEREMPIITINSNNLGDLYSNEVGLITVHNSK